MSRSPSTAKAEQKLRTHGNLLASAARLVRQRGITGTRVADVMAGAGLTVGGFYAHFASKESLVDEILRQTATSLREKLFTGIDDKPLEARAEVVLKRYLSAAHRDDAEAGCPFPAIVGEISTTAPEHRAVLEEQSEAFIERLVKELPAGDMPRRQIAIGTIALMIGGLSMARAFRGTPLSDEVLRACRAFGRQALK